MLLEKLTGKSSKEQKIFLNKQFKEQKKEFFEEICQNILVDFFQE